eukprot:6566046-Alexandrium_andersonii.AAC.1
MGRLFCYGVVWVMIGGHDLKQMMVTWPEADSCVMTSRAADCSVADCCPRCVWPGGLQRDPKS